MDISDHSDDPPRHYELWLDEVSIVGERFRVDNCVAFVNAALAAADKRRSLGVRLERQPDNQADPYAIAVFGYAKGGLFGGGGDWHIGFLNKKMAYMIAKQAPDHPLAGKLIDIEYDEDDDDDPLNIILDIYTPNPPY